MSEPPRIEFPCSYPIKVMGVNSQALRDDVLAVFAAMTDLDADVGITERESGAGRFVSITVTIIATGVEQLTVLHERLRGVPGVKLVL